MKTKILIVIIAFISLSHVHAQVGIGTNTPDASAILDIEATNKGFLLPRMTTAQRDAISSPAEGLMIYNSENNCLEFWNNTFWVSAIDGSAQPGSTADCTEPGFIPPYLTADQTEIVEVTNPVTGNTWMDRNLGAYTADRSTPSAAGGNDCWAYGNLYQWGRGNDGHEDRSSNTTNAGPVASGSEGSDFITIGSSPFDWLFTPDDDRWNANETAGGSVVKTANDPCPDGYRVPTDAELHAERSSWTQSPINSTDTREGAINSPLKLPVAGNRDHSTGGLGNVRTYGYYWSSSVAGTPARRLRFGGSSTSMNNNSRALGFSVRCLKD